MEYCTWLNHNLRRANKALENVVKFKYFRMTSTNPNGTLEEIKNRLNSVNVCYYLGQNLLVFLLAM